MLTGPNFLGVGCQNSGTTWMSACIAQHPEICFPEQKELSYFDVRYDHGWNWYQKQFKVSRRHKISGEWSPGYICCEQAFERIIKRLSDVRILVLFRNPVDRLFSHYWRYRAQGATHLSLQEVLNVDDSYVRMSRYADDWKKWQSHYGQDRCHVILFEDLIADPLLTLQKTFSFLGVDPLFVPDIELAKKRQNEVLLNKHQWIMDFVARSRIFMRGTPLSPLVDVAKSFGTRDALKAVAAADKTGYRGVALAPEDRYQLYEKYFKEDIEHLQELVPGCDFSQWRPVP